MFLVSIELASKKILKYTKIYIFTLRLTGLSVKDGRTQLKTTTSVQNVAGSSCHYFGILKALSKTLRKIWSFVLNMDGLTL